MRGYTETRLDPSLVRIFRTAQQMVDCLPDMPGLRCHEVARAVGLALDRTPIDGWYGYAEHSWLELERGRYVLDVYSVAQLPLVRLVDMDFCSRFSVRLVSSDSGLCDSKVVTYPHSVSESGAIQARTDIRYDIIDLLSNIIREAGFIEKERHGSIRS